MKSSIAWVVGALLMAPLAHADFYLKPRSGTVDQLKKVYGVHRVGMVTLEYRVMADGEVTYVSMLGSEDPELARDFRRILQRWRYEPWPFENDHPPYVDIMLPLISVYAPQGREQRLRAPLARTCQNLLDQHRPPAAGDEFGGVDWALNRAFVSGKVSWNERRALLQQLSDSWADVLLACGQEPHRPFVDFLPTHSPQGENLPESS